jgi:hypothetical protein
MIWVSRQYRKLFHMSRLTIPRDCLFFVAFSISDWIFINEKLVPRWYLNPF